MPKLRDLGEFFDGDLHLPVNGKTYVVPEPTAETCQQWTRLLFDAEADHRDEMRAIRNALGDVWDQAAADGVRFQHLRHMGRTCMYWFGMNEKIGAQYWHLAHISEMIDIDTLTSSTT